MKRVRTHTVPFRVELQHICECGSESSLRFLLLLFFLVNCLQAQLSATVCLFESSSFLPTYLFFYSLPSLFLSTFLSSSFVSLLPITLPTFCPSFSPLLQFYPSYFFLHPPFVVMEYPTLYNILATLTQVECNYLFK